MLTSLSTTQAYTVEWPDHYQKDAYYVWNLTSLNIPTGEDNLTLAGVVLELNDVLKFDLYAAPTTDDPYDGPPDEYLKMYINGAEVVLEDLDDQGQYMQV
jgi:hypothetical protein